MEGVYEMRAEAGQFMKSTLFCDIMPCSPLSVNRRIGGTYRLHLQGRKNKFSKKPAWKQVDTQRTTRHYIPEDDTLHNQICENLKPYMVNSCFP
jgi:hypothetical protein